jgi:hypothetical protein
VYRFNGEHYERFDGGYSPGQVWSPAQGPNGAALGPYAPGAAFVLCRDANKFERLAMGVSPVFAHWRGLLWITFFQPMLNQQLTCKGNWTDSERFCGLLDALLSMAG